MSFSEIKLYPVNNKTIKANGTFVYNGAVRISCTVVQGKNGPFVSLPREKYTKDGVEKWADKVYFTNEADRAALQEAVLAVFNKTSGGSQGVSPEPAPQVATKKSIPF